MAATRHLDTPSNRKAPTKTASLWLLERVFGFLSDVNVARQCDSVNGASINPKK